ncbi:MAG: hypothetical protein WD768_22255 [Phycisphaeraceae bacterium]
MNKTREVTIKKVTREEDAPPDVSHLTPGERMELAWSLTVTAWAFMGEDVNERRLPRHVVRIQRRGR